MQEQYSIIDSVYTATIEPTKYFYPFQLQQQTSQNSNIQKHANLKPESSKQIDYQYSQLCDNGRYLLEVKTQYIDVIDVSQCTKVCFKSSCKINTKMHKIMIVGNIMYWISLNKKCNQIVSSRQWIKVSIYIHDLRLHYNRNIQNAFEISQHTFRKWKQNNEIDIGIIELIQNQPYLYCLQTKLSSNLLSSSYNSFLRIFSKISPSQQELKCYQKQDAQLKLYRINLTNNLSLVPERYSYPIARNIKIMSNFMFKQVDVSDNNNLSKQLAISLFTHNQQNDQISLQTQQIGATKKLPSNSIQFHSIRYGITDQILYQFHKQITNNNIPPNDGMNNLSIQINQFPKQNLIIVYSKNSNCFVVCTIKQQEEQNNSCVLIFHDEPIHQIFFHKTRSNNNYDNGNIMFNSLFVLGRGLASNDNGKYCNLTWKLYQYYQIILIARLQLYYPPKIVIEIKQSKYDMNNLCRFYILKKRNINKLCANVSQKSEGILKYKLLWFHDYLLFPWMQPIINSKDIKNSQFSQRFSDQLFLSVQPSQYTQNFQFQPFMSNSSFYNNSQTSQFIQHKNQILSPNEIIKLNSCNYQGIFDLENLIVIVGLKYIQNLIDEISQYFFMRNKPKSMLPLQISILMGIGKQIQYTINASCGELWSNDYNNIHYWNLSQILKDLKKSNIKQHQPYLLELFTKQLIQIYEKRIDKRNSTTNYSFKQGIMSNLQIIFSKSNLKKELEKNIKTVGTHEKLKKFLYFYNIYKNNRSQFQALNYSNSTIIHKKSFKKILNPSLKFTQSECKTADQFCEQLNQQKYMQDLDSQYNSFATIRLKQYIIEVKQKIKVMNVQQQEYCQRQLKTVMKIYRFYNDIQPTIISEESVQFIDREQYLQFFKKYQITEFAKVNKKNKIRQSEIKRYWSLFQEPYNQDDYDQVTSPKTVSELYLQFIQLGIALCNIFKNGKNNMSNTEEDYYKLNQTILQFQVIKQLNLLNTQKQMKICSGLIFPWIYWKNQDKLTEQQIRNKINNIKANKLFGY